MSGHVYLSARDLSELAREMEEQGMSGWLQLDSFTPGAHVPPGAIDLSLARAAPEPRVLDDPKLWRDWLDFLAGAATNGGLVVR